MYVAPFFFPLPAADFVPLIPLTDAPPPFLKSHGVLFPPLKTDADVRLLPNRVPEADSAPTKNWLGSKPTLNSNRYYYYLDVDGATCSK